MRKSITKRIVFSYLLIILISSLMLSTLFNFVMRNALERQASETLVNDALILEEELVKLAEKMWKAGIGQKNFSREELRERFLDRRNNTIGKVLQLNTRFIFAKSDLSSILSIDRIVSFSQENEEFEKSLLEKLLETSSSITPDKIYKLFIDEVEYITMVKSFKSRNLNQQAAIVMYVAVGPVHCHKHVCYFSAEWGCTVNRVFTYKTVQIYLIWVFINLVFIIIKFNFPGKHRKHELVSCITKTVV